MRKLTVALASLALALSAHTAGAQTKFEPDLSWPKPLPDNWVLGGLGGLCVDAQDHVLILNRQDIDRDNYRALVRSPGALAACVGTIPGLKQSGKCNTRRAGLHPLGNAKLRAALWMPTLTAVRFNPWLRAHYQRLRARGKLPKVALMACMHKLLLAIYSVAKHRRPFVATLGAARAST